MVVEGEIERAQNSESLLLLWKSFRLECPAPPLGSIGKADMQEVQKALWDIVPVDCLSKESPPNRQLHDIFSKESQQKLIYLKKCGFGKPHLNFKPSLSFQKMRQKNTHGFCKQATSFVNMEQKHPNQLSEVEMAKPS